MRCKIYFTSSRKVAGQIAEVLGETAGCKPEPLFPAFLPEGVDLMFLGCDGSRGDDAIFEFINSLSSKRVYWVALFNTNSTQNSRGIELMRDALLRRGVQVLDRALVLQSHPFQKNVPIIDRQEVLDFAKESLQAVRQKTTK